MALEKSLCQNHVYIAFFSERQLSFFRLFTMRRERMWPPSIFFQSAPAVFVFVQPLRALLVENLSAGVLTVAPFEATNHRWGGIRHSGNRALDTSIKKNDCLGSVFGYRTLPFKTLGLCVNVCMSCLCINRRWTPEVSSLPGFIR